MKATFDNSDEIGISDTLPQTEQLQRAFDLLVRKTRRNIKDLANEPGTWSWALDGDYSQFKEGFFEIGNWTSSFFTGMALLAWQRTEDEYFLNQTLRLAPVYREKATVRFLDMHHDAGFLYTPYSVALYKLTGDKSHREAGLAAASALYQRFNHNGGYIRAWGRLDEPAGQLLDGRRTDNMAIIDCLMNLPLLFWASLETGDLKYHDAAVRQADTTLKCFVRPDDSVFHAYRFDLETGAPLGPDNVCGYGVDSHWARGTAWAIYGFVLAYKYTRHARYADAATRLSLKFVGSVNGDWVPVWDFKLPPGAPVIRDASALAIALCGFKELAKLGEQDAKFFHATRSMLLRLCSEEYLNFDENCRGVLRNAYGDKPAYSSWGDYFLMEALARELGVSNGWW